MVLHLVVLQTLLIPKDAICHIVQTLARSNLSYKVGHIVFGGVQDCLDQRLQSGISGFETVYLLLVDALSPMIAIWIIYTLYNKISPVSPIAHEVIVHLPVPYTLEHAAQLGVFPSHFDLRFLHAMHAVLTHLLLIAAESRELLDFFFVGC
jgi:hypothetical protein